MKIYTVTANDTLYSIADRFHISVDSIIYNNQLVEPYTLVIGQALLLSTPEFSMSNRSIQSNGYAYPFINHEILNETLPYLSELCIFSYGFTEDGFLVPPLLDDSFMITQSQLFDTAPILTLASLGTEDTFDSVLIHKLLYNPYAINQLIEQLLNVLYIKNFSGLNIDFEYIFPEDKNAFSRFVSIITETLNNWGYSVSVALAPKTSDNQPGLLYEGKDYAAIGACANSVLLMTYEWGYAYGPPMAIAPFPEVQKVVEYAVSRIPSEKIRLGIANYGYDWSLPFQSRNENNRATTIGTIEAIQIALQNNAIIQFDPVSLSPFFHYFENGIWHEVWFEDVRSLSYKYDLVQNYNLQGVGIWQAMRLFRGGLLLLADRFKIEKKKFPTFFVRSLKNKKSARRDSNPRPSPWQGDAPPLSHSRINRGDRIRTCGLLVPNQAL